MVKKLVSHCIRRKKGICPQYLATAWVIMAFLLCSAVVGAKELTVLVVSYAAPLMNYLQETALPQFEAAHSVKVNLINVTSWDQRMDKILVLNAAGTPPDVVVTGFYSHYEEGSQNLIIPLDGYIANWKYANRLPKPLWDAVKWQGKIMVVPTNLDLRGIAYNKELFAQNGYDPERPPASWDELASYASRLTKLEGNRVSVRGINLSSSGGGAAQDLFWFMRQAGLTEFDVDTFTSNIGHPDTLDAISSLQEILQAAQIKIPALGGNFATGRVAMAKQNPAGFRALYESNPEIHEKMGLFAPRRSPDSQPVSHVFVEGMAISAASRNKDLAWEFISWLHSDDVIMGYQVIGGRLAGRVDLLNRLTEAIPWMIHWYGLFNYMQASMIPPPRNIGQNELGALLAKVYSMEMSPRAAQEQGHALWTRLLAEWKQSLAK